MRVLRYCFFFGLVCLVLASITKGVEGQALTEDFVKDVKVLFPEGREETLFVQSEARHVLPGTSTAPIGKTLWAFYGCVSCQLCHAPASEQHPALSNEGDEYASNPNYDADLQRKGLACMVCHVRAHVRYGPPPGFRPSAQIWRGPGHGGVCLLDPNLFWLSQDADQTGRSQL